MSSSANGEQEPEMGRISQLQKEFETVSLNTVLFKKVEDFELDKLVRETSTFSPTPLNLNASMN